MAADKTKPADATPAATTTAAPNKMKRWMIVAGIVLGITVAECVAALIYWPKAQAAPTPDPAVPAIADAEPENEPNAEQLHEFDLGEFRVTAYQPLSNTTLRIDFHLYGMVLAGKDEETVAEQYKSKEKRLRDQVFMVIRSADMNDFTDAGLGLLRRRILETTNATLGQGLVRSIVFGDFSFIEQ